MSKVIVTKEKLDSIGNSIRSKLSSTDKYTLDQMPGAIGSISTGITPSGKISITNTNEVDVTNYATAQIVDANLKAENIASGVSVLGIVGTHQGGGGGGISLASASITNKPSKTEYYEGDTFKVSGTVLVLRYSNGASRNVDSGFTYSPTRPLTKDDTSVTISFTEYGVTKSVSVNITVSEKVVGLPTIGTNWNGSKDKALIKSLQLIPNYSTTSYTSTWDASLNSDESVIAYDLNDNVVLTWDSEKSNKLLCDSNANAMFFGCSLLTSLDLSNLDTSNVTTMQGMFMKCSSLTSLDVSNFDTSNVTTVMNMFSRCSSLTSLDVSNFNTSKVIVSMQSFVGYCTALTSLTIPSTNGNGIANTTSTMYGASTSVSETVSASGRTVTLK